MKFKLPNGVTRRVARQILVVQKNSPTLLFVGGIAGAVGATVLACQATLKLEAVLEDAVHDKQDAQMLHDGTHPKRLKGTYVYTENDYKKDLTQVYVRSAGRVIKLYGPAIMLGTISIAALTSSHKILNTRNAGLTAAYAALERGFAEYRGRVVDEYGKEKDQELRFGSQTSTVIEEDKNGPKKKQVKTVGTGKKSEYSRLFDETNQNWSPNRDYNVVFLRGVQNHSNDRLRANGHLFLNDVFDALGMDRTPAGAVTGWLLDSDGDGFVDFGVFSDLEKVRFHDFAVGLEGAVWLDFNVDGTIWDKI